jgi:hypothetical protein
MPKNLTEAIAAARAKTTKQDAAKHIVEVIEERKVPYNFRTETYHAAPRTEMY